MKLLLLPLLAAASFAELTTAKLHAEPTPYPENLEEMPGKGQIKIHPWYVENRVFFWSQRGNKQGAVVVAGDSLVGNDKGLETAFPDIMLANRGIGGDVSRGLLFRFQEDVLDLQPRTVVLLIGTNDLSAHTKPADTISNLAEILAMAEKNNPPVPVILCTIPQRNVPQAPLKEGALAELNGKIKELANDNVRILDLHTLFSQADGSLDPQYFQADQLHFSDQGYARFHQELRKMLVSRRAESSSLAAPPPGTGAWTQAFNEDFNGTALWNTGLQWTSVINNEL